MRRVYNSLMVWPGRWLLAVSVALAPVPPVMAQPFDAKQLELAERLHSVAKNRAPELAYIQTSKDIYETGEDLWFKAYLLDAQFLVPSMMSKTLYLQLISETSKKAMWQEKYEIQNGFAAGQVYLENTLVPGNYFLAAFTTFSLLNDTTEFKAIRRIRIVSDVSSVVTAAVEFPNLADWESSYTRAVIGKSYYQRLWPPPPLQEVQFEMFPEGGTIVAGIKTMVAFRATGDSGIPIEAKGTLFEDDSPKVSFETIHDGMGSFSFIPLVNKRYTVRLSEPAVDTSFILSAIKTSGTSLTLVERDRESMVFKCAQSRGINESEYYLRVQSGGVVFGMAVVKLDREARVRLPLTDIPQGIAEVALFDSNLERVAGRLIYINHEQRLYITSELSREAYPLRGKGLLKISVKDQYGEPVVAHLGVTVFDKIYQDQGDSLNILSHFYLSTQLKGSLYNPAPYFRGEEAGVDEALDLLMLTQGSDKYVWSEESLKKPWGPPEQVVYDEIRGNLKATTGVLGLKKVPDDEVYLRLHSPNKSEDVFILTVDSLGEFVVPTQLLKLWEGDYVYIKPFGPPKSVLTVKYTDPFEIINRVMKSNRISYPQPGITKTRVAPPLLFDYKVVTVPEATVKGHRPDIIRGKYLGMLDSLARFMVEDYVCRYNILNCSNHPHETDNRKPVEGESYQNGSGSTVVYHLPTYTEEELMRMNNLSRAKAYYASRKFFYPNYENDTARINIPDFRNTLLWEPMVATDKNGEALLEFYCSDINSVFVVRIEGVSGNGLLGTAYDKLTVRK